MVQKFATASELARQTGMSRWTAHRLLTGRTKKPQSRTVAKLRGAGIIPQDLKKVWIPENIRAFAIGADLRYIEVEALLRTTLKAVIQMKPAELAHVLDSAQKFPDLYGWADAATQE